MVALSPGSLSVGSIVVNRSLVASESYREEWSLETLLLRFSQAWHRDGIIKRTFEGFVRVMAKPIVNAFTRCTSKDLRSYPALPFPGCFHSSPVDIRRGHRMNVFKKSEEYLWGKFSARIMRPSFLYTIQHLFASLSRNKNV